MQEWLAVATSLALQTFLSQSVVYGARSGAQERQTAWLSGAG
jgi:hypothetical protein